VDVRRTSGTMISVGDESDGKHSIGVLSTILMWGAEHTFSEFSLLWETIQQVSEVCFTDIRRWMSVGKHL
jgi:hypothetical protein